MGIMMGMDEKDAEQALEEKRKAAETNKGEPQTSKVADEFGNNS
jgi:hypothetical protein